ncbi:hypothetical protein SEA_KABOCHA_91 [Gordonia phage Kabocha]|uniref:Rho termination factor-like N-terminal domain-containing protein n=1 Tax=Gordonia phage Chidiebere TaxID=2656530 RepID=A0A649VKQ1_9CAUD|nr:hypothetical protein PQD14_gp090 [Gordonia phage Chidiebere]QGJ92980.1 hypothetical protein PBI_CHIDIEBERE_90 [Gordonia phage Chidiebere]WAA19877.1 hypothetical protein SEA_KABOCHA_91 [Gordonia phage Kabocha]WAA20066.1 hypothetical protein SEA_HANEM_89 [Gordonia phage Hanem]WNM67109.1 hypothetical protein SEA_SCHOMBER_88 [Gordonia Phage Schomber]
MTKKSATASSDLTFENFLLELNQLTEKYLGNSKVQAAAKTVATSDAADAADDDADDADDINIPSEDELSGMGIRALRKLAAEYFEDDQVAKAKKDELIESLLELANGDLDADEDDEEDDDDEDDADDIEDDEDSDEEDEDEDDEEDEDEEEADDDEYRAELEGMKLADLRKLARDEYEAEPSEIRKLDKEGLIDLILDADAEDDSDVGVEEDDEEDGYTEDELKGMEIDALKEIADEWEIEYTPKARKATLVKLILEAQEYEDDEDYEDEDED